MNLSHRRFVSKPFTAQLLAILLVQQAVAHAQSGSLPSEPVKIGTSPQFVFDNYIVDNHFALKYKQQAVVRKFHPPKKETKNPLIKQGAGYPNVLRDPATGRFQMWYQTHTPRFDAEGNHAGSNYAIAYAESEDGLDWTLPKLNLLEWKGTKENNVVWKGITGKRASGPCLLVGLPEKDRRGFKYLMSYHTSGVGEGENGIRIVGSQDGIHWDKSSDKPIVEIHSDTLNSIVYDPTHQQYLMFCRAKHIYRTFRGGIIDTGASRRVAVMRTKNLWSRWESEPQTILIPDELDSAKNFNFFYGMPVKYHAGIFWGFLWGFKMNSDIVPELAFSRDGINFSRLHSRPALIALGPEESWDDGMAFTSTGWVEVGDEWWLYYAGHDGPHNSRERNAGIGLVKLPKERFISLHGPSGGGAVITRKIVWPGGKLLLNANASEGELKVRISDAKRKVLEGFDYDDCITVSDDSITHDIRWKEKSIESLKGKVIRLEIFLKDADLFTFRSTAEKSK